MVSCNAKKLGNPERRAKFHVDSLPNKNLGLVGPVLFHIRSLVSSSFLALSLGMRNRMNIDVAAPISTACVPDVGGVMSWPAGTT